MMPTWPNVNTTLADGTVYWHYESGGLEVTEQPAPPEIPPEVWRVKPEIDTTDYMGAVRAMCRGQ